MKKHSQIDSAARQTPLSSTDVNNPPKSLSRQNAGGTSRTHLYSKNLQKDKVSNTSQSYPLLQSPGRPFGHLQEFTAGVKINSPNVHAPHSQIKSELRTKEYQNRFNNNTYGVISTSNKGFDNNRQKATSSLHERRLYNTNSKPTERFINHTSKALKKSPLKAPSGILSGNSEFSRKKKPRGSVAFKAEQDTNDEYQRAVDLAQRQSGKSTPMESMFETYDAAGKPPKPPTNMGFSYLADKQSAEAQQRMENLETRQPQVIDSIIQPRKQRTAKNGVTFDSRTSSMTGPDISVKVIAEDASNLMSGEQKSNFANKHSVQDMLSGHSVQNLLLPSIGIPQGVRRNGSMPPQHNTNCLQSRLKQSIQEFEGQGRDIMGNQLSANFPMSRVKSHRALGNMQFNSASGVPLLDSKLMSPTQNMLEDNYEQSQNAQVSCSINLFKDGDQRSLLSHQNLDLNNVAAETHLKSPVTARMVIERKYTKLMEENKKQTEAMKLTQHGFTKRHEKLLNEKQAALEDLDQKQKNKQYLKERAKQQKVIHKSSQKLTQITPGPKKSTKKLSERQKTSEKPIGERNKQFQSFQSLSRIQQQINGNQPEQHAQSQPNLLLTNRNKQQNLQSSLKQLTKSSFGTSTHENLPKTSFLESVNLKTKEQHNQGSSLFKTIDSTKYSMRETDHLKRSYNHVLLLAQDVKGISAYQKQKQMDKKSNQRGKSQPTGSIMEDLTDTGINFTIPESVNPHGLKRTLTNRQPGSSLPTTLILKDKSGNQLIRNVAQQKQDAIRVQDMDFNSVSDNNENESSQHKVLKLAQETKKHNRFLSQLQTELDRTQKVKRIEDTLAQTMPTKTGQQKLINVDLTMSTDQSIGGESLYGLTGGTQMFSSIKQFRSKKHNYTTFENKLQEIASKGDKQGNVNVNILQLIQSPEMTGFPDFAKSSIQAEQTEIKTLLYELKSCMNQQSMSIVLDSTAPSTQASEVVKNENIELIPRLPIHCKVSIKERIAPLKLKFEFFDMHTKVKLKNPDVVVCVSPTVQCPTVENCFLAKTEFRDPYISMYRELQGKPIPEFTPQSKNDKFPQQVYISLLSMTGCYSTITVSFPLEKKALQFRMKREPKQTLKNQKNQLSKEEEYFKELQDIDEDLTQRQKYRDTYRNKEKFIQEEIQRCTDLKNYTSEVVKQAHLKMKTNKDKRQKQCEANRQKREDVKTASIVHFVERQKMLNVSKSTGSLHSQMTEDDSIEKQLRIVNSEVDLASSPMKQQLARQKIMRQLKTAQANQIRKQQYEEKQKRRHLIVIKQQLLQKFKHEQFSQKQEQLRISALVETWVKKISLWNTISQIYEIFSQRKQEHIESRKRMESAALIVRLAGRYYLNSFGQWGKTYAQRMQTKLSTGCLHLYALRKDEADKQSKQQVLKFLEAMSARMDLSSRIKNVTKAVKMVSNNWFFYKFRYLVKQALMRRQIEIKMQQWHKAIQPLSGDDKTLANLVPKEDKSEIKMMYQKLEDNPGIVTKNLVPFARMIKLEGIIQSFHTKTALDILRATRKLQAVEEEIALYRQQHGLVDLDQLSQESTVEDGQTPGTAFSRSGALVKCQSFDLIQLHDESEMDFLKRKRKEIEVKLNKYKAWQTSKYLKKLEQEYKQISEQMYPLKHDRSNYALVCWKGMDDYDEIMKAAKTFKSKLKGMQKAHVKGHKKKYGEQQATRVRKAFKEWNESRRRDFHSKLHNHIQRLSKLPLSQDIETVSKVSLDLGRPTQPEELAFLFMKIIDEIGAAKQKAKKFQKVQKEISRAHRDTITSQAQAQNNADLQ